MIHTNYTLQRDHLLNSFTSDLQLAQDEDLQGQLQLVSAGLVNYLPAIPVESHDGIFKEVLLHKKLSILEQGNYEVLDYVETEGLGDEMMNLLRTKPVVICTFHTGSYRVLNLFLCRHHIPYALVTGKEVMEKEGQLFNSLFQQLPGQASFERLPVIDAEAANSGLQMLRTLKAGRSLLLYIDGNAGAGVATARNENSCVVDFLHQQIYARKGIAFLAHLAKVPLVTVASYRKNREEICLKFFDPVFPDLQQPRDVFAAATTQLIYDQVAPIIKQYPEQWEAWLYIHKVAKVIHVPVDESITTEDVLAFQKVTFNSARFGIFKLHAKPFLLKKHSYSFYEISTRLYDVLIRCVGSPIEKTCFNSEQLLQLQQEGVLRFT